MARRRSAWATGWGASSPDGTPTSSSWRRSGSCFRPAVTTASRSSTSSSIAPNRRTSTRCSCTDGCCWKMAGSRSWTSPPCAIASPRRGAGRNSATRSSPTWLSSTGPGTRRRSSPPTSTTRGGRPGRAGDRSGPGQAEHRGEIGPHDPAQLLLRYRGKSQAAGLLVHSYELVPELGRIVEEAGVVGAEEDLLKRHEGWLAAVQQQEEIAPGQRRDQVGQLGVEVRVLRQQEEGL